MCSGINALPYDGSWPTGIYVQIFIRLLLFFRNLGFIWGFSFCYDIPQDHYRVLCGRDTQKCIDNLIQFSQ